MSKASNYLIALDDGHGMKTAGKRSPTLPNGLKSETGNFMHENEFNRAVKRKLNKKLKDCGFKTVLVAPTDDDTPLSTRVRVANTSGADIYVSIHANAFDGKFDGNDPEGVETYHYPTSSKGKKLANTIHKHLIQGTKQKNRGVKTANFYVLKHTKMPAVLIEAGFMDSPNEIKLLLSDAFREEVATEIAKGICEYFGVPYVSTAPASTSKPSNTTSDVIYRVRKSWSDAKTQKGAFKDLNRAKELANKNEGYKVFDPNGKVVYEPKQAPVVPNTKALEAEIAELTKENERIKQNILKIGASLKQILKDLEGVI